VKYREASDTTNGGASILPVPDIAKRRDQRLTHLFGRWRLWAPLVLILFAALVSILSSQSFSKCMAGHSGGEGFRDGAILKFRCVGSFVVDYAPAISAVAEGGIALIVFVLWVYVSDVLKNAAAQSDLIRHSVELTRVALVSSAPPALVFRGFSVVERSFGETQRVQVNFTVTNRGGTAATITDTGAAVVFMQSMLPPDINFAKRAITNVTLRSGEGTSWPVASAEPLSAAEVNALHQGTTKIVCVGYFTYKDDFGTIRNTGFARQYDLVRRRWSVLADPDYEYSS
jgi:hypothetical protein